MEYMGNKEFWDEKFSNRSDNPMKPEKVLVDNLKFFKRGSVLDIACGDGRNSLFLLQHGFEVTGVDFSSTALARLRMFAERNNYSVDTKEIDLSGAGSLKNIGTFDNILINHYRLSRDQLAEIPNHLTGNGILFVCGFGYKHKVDVRIREEDLIQPEDFEGINKSLELIKYIDELDDRGYFVTYIFQKTISAQL